MTVVGRRVLHHRRQSETFTVSHMEASGALRPYTVTFSQHDLMPDGRPGWGGSDVAEVFIDTSKSGSDQRESIHDAAVLLSLALQHGVSLALIGGALSRGEQMEPLSPIGTVVDALLKRGGAS